LGSRQRRNNRAIREALPTEPMPKSLAAWQVLGALEVAIVAICALSLGLRLIHLNLPLVDEQAWRQTDTAAVARNYFEEGFSFFYPRIDWRGATPGFVEMEFPLYPFLVACAYAILGGTHEWVGRLLSALLSTATIPLLYLLARDHYGQRVARMAAFIFAVAPLNVFFGRAFMPESMMLFFSVAAIYFFEHWLDGRQRRQFVVAAAATALAFLVKLPTLYLAMPLLFIAYDRFGVSLVRRSSLWLFSAIVLLPTFAWYAHAHNLFEETHLTFGIWSRYGYVKWGRIDHLITARFYLTMLERLGGMTFTPVGLALLVLGLLTRVRSRRDLTFHAWVLALVVYVLLVPEGNLTLNYYQLPFVPVGAIFIGKALDRILERGAATKRTAFRWVTPVAAAGALLSICGLGYGYAAALFEPNPYDVALYEIGRRVDVVIPQGALVIVGDLDDDARGAIYRSQNPALLYYCHRKGWQLLPEDFKDVPLIRSLLVAGARYILHPDRLLDDGPRSHVTMTLFDAAGRLLERFDFPPSAQVVDRQRSPRAM
jgi:4-amino-4-deoxy-L-arabinose transferase-like glycosyltransferase